MDQNGDSTAVRFPRQGSEFSTRKQHPAASGAGLRVDLRHGHANGTNLQNALWAARETAATEDQLNRVDGVRVRCDPIDV